MDWPVFLINLDKDRARLEATTGDLARAGVSWQRIAGVNGRALSGDEIAAVYDSRSNRTRARHPLTAPEIGCYLSHIKAWSALRTSGAPGAIVLEDDFRITGDLAGVISALSTDTGSWDIAKLFTFRPDATLAGAREIGPDIVIGRPYKVPTTMLGYAIRADAANRLLRLSQPFFRPVDEDVKFFWEKQLEIALVRPQPIEIGRQDTAEGSVGESRQAASQHDPRPGYLRALQGVRYQAGYLIGLHRHRWMGR